MNLRRIPSHHGKVSVMVVMATKMLNLRKVFKKNQLPRSNKGDKAESFAEMLISLASTKMLPLFMSSDWIN